MKRPSPGRYACAAAALALVLGGMAQARPADPQVRQWLTEFGACTAYIAVFERAIDDEAASEADRQLYSQAQGLSDTLTVAVKDRQIALDNDEVDKIVQDVSTSIAGRVTAYQGREDIKAALRDEFRADLRACVATTLSRPIPASVLKP